MRWGCCLGEQTSFCQDSFPSLLGVGRGATDGERCEDTKEEARHCQDPNEEGWRAAGSAAWPLASFLRKMASSSRRA